MCILYVLLMCLNSVLNCCTHYNLYNGENEVGPDCVIFFPINAPGMGRFKLFNLVGYS